MSSSPKNKFVRAVGVVVAIQGSETDTRPFLPMTDRGIADCGFATKCSVTSSPVEINHEFR